jgi:hypothetical protein
VAQQLARFAKFIGACHCYTSGLLIVVVVTTLRFIGTWMTGIVLSIVCSLYTQVGARRHSVIAESAGHQGFQRHPPAEAAVLSYPGDDGRVRRGRQSFVQRLTRSPEFNSVATLSTSICRGIQCVLFSMGVSPGQSQHWGPQLGSRIDLPKQFSGT